MKDGIRLLTTELDGNDGVVVTFSDGTTGAYVAEELLELRPYRERLRNRKIRNVPSKGPNDENSEHNASGTDCAPPEPKVSHSRH